jgi:hypothetical protein
MTSLVVLTTEDMPRLQNLLRTIKVASMPTMWKQVKPLLAIVPALVELIPPSNKSKGSVCDHLYESTLEAPLLVNWKRTTTFSWENSPQRLMGIPVGREETSRALFPLLLLLN